MPRSTSACDAQDFELGRNGAAGEWITHAQDKFRRGEIVVAIQVMLIRQDFVGDGSARFASRRGARGMRSLVEGDAGVDEMPRAVRDEGLPAAHLSVEPAQRALILRNREA